MMRKLMVAVWMMVAGTCPAQDIDLKLWISSPRRREAKRNQDGRSDGQVCRRFPDDKKAGEGTREGHSKNIKGIYLRSYELPERRLQDRGTETRPGSAEGPTGPDFLETRKTGSLPRYGCTRLMANRMDCLLVTAEANELTVINLVGSVNLADLSSLGNLGNLSTLANAAGKQQAAPDPQATPAAPKKD